MSKRTFYILGIITTLLIGVYLHTKYCCIDCYSPGNESKPLKFKNNLQIQSNVFQITGYGFDYSCEANFNFNTEDSDFIQPVEKSITTGIDQLKVFLDKNPNRRLIITGDALSSEKNTSAFPNLGFARANKVKN